MEKRAKTPLRLGAILRARCPACHEGKVLQGLFVTRRRCETCGYDFHPESGFYLGAMMMAFMLNAMLTIPPLVILKIMDASPTLLFVFPFLEFLVVGTLLILYARIVWLHLEYRISNRLDGEGAAR